MSRTKIIKAFGRAAATLKPSERRKLFGASIDHDQIARNSFTEGLIQGLDADRAVRAGLPEPVASGRLSWQSLSEDADRAIRRESERRFRTDRALNPLQMGRDDYFDTWKRMSEKYRQDVLNDLRNKSTSIQDLLDPVNNQWNIKGR